MVKVLARDPGVVSVRLYSEQFKHRPKSVAQEMLTLGPAEGEKGLGIGHLPVTEREFELWYPVFLSDTGVREDELEGYRIWKESDGGAFDDSAEEQEND